MTLENKHKLRPDNILTSEFGSETNNTANEIQMDSTPIPNLQQESEILKDAVTVLMDLDPAQCMQYDKSVENELSHTEEEEEYNTDDSSAKSDDSYCSDDLSKSDYLESDDDLDEEFYNIERLLHKCQLAVPDQEIYHIKIRL